jgi:hypothetical protein
MVFTLCSLFSQLRWGCLSSEDVVVGHPGCNAVWICTWTPTLQKNRHSVATRKPTSLIFRPTWRWRPSGIWHPVVSSPWWWRQYAPPKRRSTSRLHVAIFLKAVIFILAAVRTWNLTYIYLFTSLEHTNYFLRPLSLATMHVYLQ